MENQTMTTTPAPAPSLLRTCALSLLVVFGVSLGLAAQGGPPPGGGRGGGMRGGMMGDPSHMADMEVFQALLTHREKIRRTVTERPDGVVSVTESDDPAVAALIQSHVNAMYGRIKEARPIHQRDPLFRAVFENTDKIVMTHEMTPTGIKVTETSTDPWVADLIKAHAEVVNLFVKNGRAEMMKNHEVPKRPQ
jgi:uncharacterized protein